MRTKLVVEATKEAVKSGDRVKCFRGETYTLDYYTAPHKLSSSGHVYVLDAQGVTHSYYPSVFGLKFVEES